MAITLISSDGQRFEVEEEVAMASGTIRNMMNCQMYEQEHGIVQFDDIRSNILAKVIEYLYYKVKYKDAKVDIPEFQIEPDIALDLLMAADYLEC